MDVTKIKGLGESSAKLLHKLKLDTIEDLIENIPRKYDDYSQIQPIRGIKPGAVTIKATLSSVRGRYSRKGLHITEALASDDSGSVKVMWFNQPYRAQSLKAGEQYYLSGEFAQNYRYLVLNNPTCELVSSFPLHTARLVPQYRLTKGLGAHQLRKFTKAAFDMVKVHETLPSWLVREKKLMSRDSALFQMHFPDKLDDVAAARRRLGFEEFFEMSLASELNKQAVAAEKALHIPFQEEVVVNFVKKLPFQLTDDQRKSAWQILQDMTEGHPMNRLLQGDVGSGKTVVAAIAMVNAAASGFQTALMAPTELLAAQHARSIEQLLPDGLKDKLLFLSGSMKPSQKKRAHEAIVRGDAMIIVGTHAIIQEHVQFHNLGLAIIDEQHRFGVEQRKALQGKAKELPHILNMTATPIPRSIALTLYGEMDVSTIREKPKNRQAVSTRIVIPEAREQLYKQIAKYELEKGRQVFVVCPQIVDDDKPGRSLSVEHITKQVGSWLKGHKVAGLHGKMKSEEKDTIMQDFVGKKYDVLVSTTVIEVGVDVPNASMMIIEGADRFGLAQLHQLRGRVGRGEHGGECVLVTTENSNPTERLRIIASEHDGFKLAEYDLDLRGPGAIYGTLQHGALDLRVAKITDTALIREARESAKAFIKKKEKLVQYPALHAKVSRLRTITNLN